LIFIVFCAIWGPPHAERKKEEKMAGSEQKPKRRGGSRNAGMTWSWGTLKRDAIIHSEEHLIFRFIADTKIYSIEKLAEICESTAKEVKNILYGVAKRSRKRMVMLIAEHMEVSYGILLLMAQKWYAGEDPGDISVQVESLEPSAKRVYDFRRGWLQKMGWDAKKLKTMKQSTDFLLPEGIAPGDLLLINTADTTFNAGAFYAASIAEENRACMGSIRGVQRVLIVESTGRKFQHSNFDEIDQAGGVIGRIVWRGTLMP
jgi:hypothetical protein